MECNEREYLGIFVLLFPEIIIIGFRKTVVFFFKNFNFTSGAVKNVTKRYSTGKHALEHNAKRFTTTSA